MKKEKADLDKIKAAKIQVPAYWTDKDSKSTGFKMQPVDFGTQSLLEQAMNTSAWSDDTSGVSPYDATPYTHLGVAKAWRCEVRAGAPSERAQRASESITGVLERASW
jgi:hypothetical protein